MALSDAHGGMQVALPPGHPLVCHNNVLPVSNRGEIPCNGNAEESQCASALNGSRTGAGGDEHHNKKGVWDKTFPLIIFKGRCRVL